MAAVRCPGLCPHAALFVLETAAASKPLNIKDFLFVLKTSRMKPWLERAQAILRSSLSPPLHEANELDWKAALSPDKARLSDHLCAFANYPGGGYLVFGITDDGTLKGVASSDIESIVNKLANLGRDAVEPMLQLDHEGVMYEGVRLLFVHIPEALVKPVHLRSKPETESFIRSGGTTRKASRQEVGSMMLNSKTLRWEDLHSTPLLSDEEVLDALNANGILALLQKQPILNLAERLKWMNEASLIERHPSGGAYITNLGAITAARTLSTFSELTNRAARVIVYEGLNKGQFRKQVQGQLGYALSFANLIEFVSRELPASEVIEQALRKRVPLYPTLALREIIANALVHQDFTVSGSGPLIEIYDDRVEVSNPGRLLPSKSPERLIGTQPEARNEKLARAFRRYGICEEQGSGLIKAGLQVEIYGLPPIRFEQQANHFKVTLLAPRTFAQMSQTERLEACYQHAVLRYLSSSTMTNKSLRERLKMPEKQRSAVSLVIKEALDKHLIASLDPQNKSRKFSEYIPYWAAVEQNSG